MKPLNMFNANDIIDQARSIINRLEAGSEFRLKDLFRGIEWDEFKKNERLSAGTMFRAQANSRQLPVVSTGKTSSNSAVYRKI